MWNTGFDPIVEAMADALGIECPIYVDDLLAFVWGPQQALEAEVLLLVLGSGWLVRFLVCWLVGWFAGCLFVYLFVCLCLLAGLFALVRV